MKKYLRVNSNSPNIQIDKIKSKYIKKYTNNYIKSKTNQFLNIRVNSHNLLTITNT